MWIEIEHMDIWRSLLMCFKPIVLNCMRPSSGYMQKGILFTPQSNTRHACSMLSLRVLHFKLNHNGKPYPASKSMFFQWNWQQKPTLLSTQKMLLKNYKIVSYPSELFIYLKTVFHMVKFNLSTRLCHPPSFHAMIQYYMHWSVVAAAQITFMANHKTRTWNTQSIYTQLNNHSN